MQASHKLLIIRLKETPAFAGVTIIDLALPYFAKLYIAQLPNYLITQLSTPPISDTNHPTTAADPSAIYRTRQELSWSI